MSERVFFSLSVILENISEKNAARSSSTSSALACPFSVRNKEIIVGAGALLSVIAVPVTILAGILLGNKRGKN